MRIIHENENIYDIRYILLHFVREKSDGGKIGNSKFSGRENSRDGKILGTGKLSGNREGVKKIFK